MLYSVWWLGHTLKMPGDRLPISDKLLFGQVKGFGAHVLFNDLAMRDCQLRHLL